MTRAAFSERKVIETLLRQAAVICCYRCQSAFTIEDAKTVEREHLQEIALGGENTPGNCRYSHKACHSIVTNGTRATSAGSSKHRIAKVNRIRDPKKPKGNLSSRPFGKHSNPWGRPIRSPKCDSDENRSQDPISEQN